MGILKYIYTHVTRWVIYWRYLMSLLNNVTIVLFICHVLGDFQFQSQEMSDVKIKSLYGLIKHLLIHALVLILLLSEYVFNSNRTLNIGSSNILKWILLLLVIAKPANITFKIVFQKFQFKTNSETIPGAGAIIGNLERILSAIFLAMNQITAIGFIYTAKSIARFKEIEENRGFAEYYLIGTLFSILYVLIAYFFIIVL